MIHLAYTEKLLFAEEGERFLRPCLGSLAAHLLPSVDLCGNKSHDRSWAGGGSVSMASCPCDQAQQLQAGSTSWRKQVSPPSASNCARRPLQVNGIAFHPVHGTLATVGSDGRFSFWDKDARTKLKTSEQLDQPISACCFNHNGNIFAYASSYDWSKVSVRSPPHPSTHGRHTGHFHFPSFWVWAARPGQALVPVRSSMRGPLA